VTSLCCNLSQRSNGSTANTGEENVHASMVHFKRPLIQTKMIQKILNLIRNRGHSWRSLSMSELGEIYSAMMLRSLALSVIGVFVPVYLYQNGYDVIQILLFFAVFFLNRTIFDVVAGYLVARWGPKHTMMLSNI